MPYLNLGWLVILPLQVHNYQPPTHNRRRDIRSRRHWRKRLPIHILDILYSLHKAFMLIKKCVPQATHTTTDTAKRPVHIRINKQSALWSCEQCLIILVYISSATHPNKIGGFVVWGLFSSNMQCVSARIHTSKLNIFSRTIKVSDCFLQYSVFIWQNYTSKMPKAVSVTSLTQKRVDCQIVSS